MVEAEATAVFWMPAWLETNSSMMSPAGAVPMNWGVRSVVTLSPTIPVSSAGFRWRLVTGVGFVLSISKKTAARRFSEPVVVALAESVTVEVRLLTDRIVVPDGMPVPVTTSPGARPAVLLTPVTLADPLVSVPVKVLLGADAPT